MSIFSKKIYSPLIFFAAIISGASIPTSTAAQNIGAALLLLYFFTKLNNFDDIKNASLKPFSIAGLLLGMALILGIFWTTTNNNAAWGFFIKMRAYYLIPIFLLTLSTTGPRNALLLSFAAATIISIIISIVSALFNHPIFMAIPGDWYIFRTHTYHNYFAALLSTGIFAGLLSKKIPPAWRLIATTILLLGSIDILFLVSGRTGQIIYLLMLLLVLIQWNWRLALPIGAFSAIAAFFILMNFSTNIHQGFNKAELDLQSYSNGNSNTSVGLRLEWHKRSMQLIKEKPFFGHGTGSFKDEYARTLEIGDELLASHNPHNDYLWMGVELGFLGIFLLIALLISAAWQGRNLETPWRWVLYAMLAGMGTSTLANSFFTDNITGLAFVLLTCALLNGPKNLLKI